MTRSLRGSIWILLALVSVATACSPASQPQPMRNPAVEELVFLTRDGCVNTTTMRANLDAALKALALPNEYQFIDADTLAASDPRGGYGTPTSLYGGRDLFDMPEPAVPYPPPT